MKKTGYDDIKNHIVGEMLTNNNILIVDIVGESPANNAILFYEISSGTAHRARLYISPYRDDCYFISRGRRLWVSDILFYCLPLAEQAKAKTTAGVRRRW